MTRRVVVCLVTRADKARRYWHCAQRLQGALLFALCFVSTTRVTVRVELCDDETRGCLPRASQRRDALLFSLCFVMTERVALVLCDDKTRG